MDVTVDVVGEGTETVEASAEATYADLVRAVGYSTHEVTVLVDGRPVPEDQPVTAESVRVLRLVKGGAPERSGGASERSAAGSERRTGVRLARAGEYRATMRVLEGALLDVDPGRVRTAVDDGRALVAAVSSEGGTDGDDGRVVGAAVREGDRLLAVAVTSARRGRGIGRALAERADDDADGPLSATFDPRVRGFYEALGFAVEPTGDGRLRGVRRRDDG